MENPSETKTRRQFNINETIELIATHCERASIVNPKPVIALVADQNLIFGLSRMWELLVGATDWETMVFRKREGAEIWITQKVKKNNKVFFVQV